MTRMLLKVVSGLTFVLTLFCAVPAVAQERLFVFQEYGNYLAEVETEESRLGVIRRFVKLPYSQVTPLAGGRFLLLSSWYSIPAPPALFDTRTFAIIMMPQWAALDGAVAFDSDALRPRIFYRTTSEFGVIEGPSFIPRVLGQTGDPSNSGGGSLKFVAGSNMLLVARQLSYTQSLIAGFDADTGALRGAVTFDGQYGPLLVDTLSRSLHVPVGMYQNLQHSSKIQTYDLSTFALVNETATYPLTQSDFPFFWGASWTFDPMRQQILRADGGMDGARRAWAVALDTGFGVAARVDFSQRWGAVNLMPSTVRDRTLAFLMTPGYGGSSSGPGRRATASLMVLDATTLEPRATVDLQATNGPITGGYSAILLSPPPPPSSLAHTINGRRVELTWRDPGDATHFLVQAGSEPGRSNLGTLHVGGVTQFASDVPPGRYYIRTRAVNDVGLSVPSNEIVVVVP